MRFYNCTSLTSVTIPTKVKTIGTNAFKGCTGLTSITLPSSVTTVSDNAFAGDTLLKTVTIDAVSPSIKNKSAGERLLPRLAAGGVVSCLPPRRE